MLPNKLNMIGDVSIIRPEVVGLPCMMGCRKNYVKRIIKRLNLFKLNMFGGV